MRKKYSSSDFVISMLPSNRKKQFFDLLKTRYSVLLKIFFASLLFSLPLLVSYSIKYFFILESAAIELSNNQDSYLAFFKLTNIIFYGVDIINYLILFIGYAGIFNIFKKISWSEPVSFWKDFLTGIKQNWKMFLVTSLFISIFRFVTKTFAILSDYHFFSYIVTAIFFVSLPLFFFSVTLYEIYNVKIFEAYSKGSLFYIKRMGFSILFLLYPVIVAITKYYVDEFFGLGTIGFFLMMINLSIVLPLFLLSWHLFNLSCFDAFTNKEHFKDYYHKGLSDNIAFNQEYKDEETFLLK